MPDCRDESIAGWDKVTRRNRIRLVRDFIARSNRALATGMATEMTLRHYLIECLEGMLPDAVIVNEPFCKKLESARGVDIAIVKDNRIHSIVETKNIKVGIHAITTTGQIKRYATESFPMLVTNYLEWQVSRGMQKVARGVYGSYEGGSIQMGDEEYGLLAAFLSFFLFNETANESLFFV